MRTTLATLLIAASLFVTACGSSDPLSTGTLPVGHTVGADQYLADAAVGAAAVRDYATAVATLPNPATPQALQALAPQLSEPLSDAEGASQRLSAMRLEDQRLESQRAQSAQVYSRVLAAMRRLEAAARAGNPQTAQKAAQDLNTVTAQLRAIGEADTATTGG